MVDLSASPLIRHRWRLAFDYPERGTARVSGDFFTTRLRCWIISSHVTESLIEEGDENDGRVMERTRAGVPAVASLVKVRRKGGLIVCGVTKERTPCSTVSNVAMIGDKAPDL